MKSTAIGRHIYSIGGNQVAARLSGMIDGSRLSFEENIRLTKRVADVAKPSGIPVEGELGTVGGKEDDLEGGEGRDYTDPQKAAEFVARTGISSLAVAIGTAHGVYKKTPKLDIERLSEIRKAVSVPLVLHGCTGVPDGDVAKCIKEGICKVNYATELRIAFSEAVKDYLKQNPETFDPKLFGKAGSAKVKELVKRRVLLCGDPKL